MEAFFVCSIHAIANCASQYLRASMGATTLGNNLRFLFHAGQQEKQT
jgi:hypothetical protein